MLHSEKAVLKCKFLHRRRYTEKVALCVRLPAANGIQSKCRFQLTAATYYYYYYHYDCNDDDDDEDQDGDDFACDGSDPIHLHKKPKWANHLHRCASQPIELAGCNLLASIAATNLKGTGSQSYALCIQIWPKQYHIIDGSTPSGQCNFDASLA